MNNLTTIPDKRFQLKSVKGAFRLRGSKIYGCVAVAI